MVVHDEDMMINNDNIVNHCIALDGPLFLPGSVCYKVFVHSFFIPKHLRLFAISIMILTMLSTLKKGKLCQLVMTKI